jgi:hypothetical protein
MYAMHSKKTDIRYPNGLTRKLEDLYSRLSDVDRAIKAVERYAECLRKHGGQWRDSKR